MRLTRVYVIAPLTPGATLQLPPGPARHLSRVLRMEAGAPLRVFNGSGGEHEAVIETVRREAVTVRIGAHHAVSSESSLQVTLLQGIARGEKMDLILQKSTELGVTRIVPVAMARSTVRLDAATAHRKQAHWQGVVAGACEQSGRDHVPEVAEPCTFAAAVVAADGALKLLLAPDAEARGLSALLATRSVGAGPLAVCLLVGPEGGFDPAEIRVARDAGFEPCRLGPRILRTETAALTALAALQFAAGDLA